MKGEEAIARQIGELPHALEDDDQLVRDLASRRLAVFLDYDHRGAPASSSAAPTTRRWPDGPTAADYVLHGVKEVERFLDTLAR